MNSNQIMVKMVLDRWHALIKNVDTSLETITDEQLLQEIAPGRNRGIYILGHLIAVHDAMLPILNFGNQLYPDLNEIFIQSPDKSIAQIPSARELRKYWGDLNTVLDQKYNTLQADDWFEKHTSVSAEDFINEPHRNKLNIILTRTTHLAYHLGQLKLIR